VPNKHTKQLHSKNSAQFYVVRPIHAAPAIPACHKRPAPAYIWPPNGQTAGDRAKPNPPSRSPLNFKARTESSHGPAGFLDAPASATKFEILSTCDLATNGEGPNEHPRPGPQGPGNWVWVGATCWCWWGWGAGAGGEAHVGVGVLFALYFGCALVFGFGFLFPCLMSYFAARCRQLLARETTTGNEAARCSVWLWLPGCWLVLVHGAAPQAPSPKLLAPKPQGHAARGA
jgi:hypothetical protein